MSQFLGELAKLQKATISLVMSVRPWGSVRSHRTTPLPTDGFSRNLLFEDF